MSEVASRILQCLDPGLRATGSSLDALLVDHGLSAHRVRFVPGSRISWNAFADVLEDAGARLGGLQALEEIGANCLVWSWGTIRAVVARYVSPYRAFELGVRWFGPAIFRGIRGHLEEIPGGLIETVVIPQDRRDSLEFFALCRGVMRAYPALLGWETRELQFRHSDRRGEYRLTYARAQVHPDPRSERGESAGLDQDLEELAILQMDLDAGHDLLSTPRPGGVSTAEAVRSIFHGAERGLGLTTADAARGLGMSERSLARRLAAEGTSFRALRDEVRRDVAIERIRRGTPIAEVADLLGFADVPSFHRAFRRWTGQAPGHFKLDASARSDGGNCQENGGRSQFGFGGPSLA